MRITRVLVLVLAVVFLAVAVIASQAHAVLKMAPTEAEPGHPFTIFDTPDQRIVDGSVAVFRLFGIETVLALRTHEPYNTAQSRLASNMYGGIYTVFLRQPNGTELEIGPFTVLGPSVPPPFIEPDLGPPGTTFTITDYLARIESGDLAVFYAEGKDPATEGVAAQGSVSPDGTSLTGTVPGGAAQGVQNFVSVGPLGGPSRFGDLAFFVTELPQPPVAFTLTLNKTSFSTPGTVTDDQIPQQINCPTTCQTDSGIYTSGTTVTLTAEGVGDCSSSGSSGIYVLSWGGDAPASCNLGVPAILSTCTIEMTANMVVTVTFEMCLGY